MKIVRATLTLLLVLTSAAAAQPVERTAPGAERITDFVSEIDVRPNGDLIVAEQIAVIAAGDNIQRGIYRDFPTLYHSALGLRRRVAFDVLEVTRDGRPEPWRREVRENGVRVYIGNPDVLLPPGPHTYHLRYRTNRQLVLRPDFDELYWNATGNQWSFPIERATARVTLPPGASVRELTAYTGRTGEQGRDWRVEPSAQWDAEVATTRPLAPGEGLTLSATWRKGVVSPDANRESPLDLALDNAGLALALTGLVLVLAYYAVAWFLVGRDPPRGVIIPLYGPPADFTPAAVRYVTHLGRFDDASLAATLLHLAVAGTLRIRRREDKTYVLERGETPAGKLPATERPFFEELLASRKTLELKNTNHRVFSAARATLHKSVRADFEKRYFARNAWWWLGGLVLSLLPALVSLLDARNAGTAVFMTVWLSFWSLGVFALLGAAFTAWRSGKILAALPITLFSIPFVLGWIFGAVTLVQATSFWIAGVFFTAFAINALFCHLLKAPTAEGRRVMDQIEGFRRYLVVGERERLDLENPPERTPAHYETFLPYALALGVEQRWSEQFTDVLTAAQYEPDWYQGSDRAFASPAAFATGLGHSLSNAISSSASAPGSSSGRSSGGGSSGGGGGGGGGGGW